MIRLIMVGRRGTECLRSDTFIQMTATEQVAAITPTFPRKRTKAPMLLMAATRRTLLVIMPNACRHNNADCHVSVNLCLPPSLSLSVTLPHVCFLYIFTLCRPLPLYFSLCLSPYL